jgi:hypothetical protein
MRWRKLGRIFDPTEHALGNNCVGFAQSPQALVLDGLVRFYFSTRAIDPANGKHLSHVAFVEFKRNLRDIVRVSQHTVLSLGGLGCFDEHGIFPMSVLPCRGLVYGYTCGWSRRISVSIETAIGLAISRDGGETFSREGDGPILSASLQEPFLVGDGYVRIVGSIFHMWYIFGTAWKTFAPGSPPDRVYKIAHATSHDGRSWIKEEGRQIVADRLGPDESQALPSVVQIDGRFHMFFCYRHSSDFRRNRARAYRIGHAYSEDLVTWVRDDIPVIDCTPGDWDADMLCYPNVFHCDGQVYLAYNGNEFGRHGFGLAVLER